MDTHTCNCPECMVVLRQQRKDLAEACHLFVLALERHDSGDHIEPMMVALGLMVRAGEKFGSEKEEKNGGDKENAEQVPVPLV